MTKHDSLVKLFLNFKNITLYIKKIGGRYETYNYNREIENI